MRFAAVVRIWVFLALNLGTSGRVTLSDVPGFYKLQFSGVDYCYFLFEMRGSDSVLNATDAFMDGVQFVTGYVNLSETPGRIDWNAEEGRSEWNRSLGPIVNGAISRSRDGEPFRMEGEGRWDYTGTFIIMKPNIDFQVPTRRFHLKRMYNLTKGEVYLYHETKNNDCLYKKGDPNQVGFIPTPTPPPPVKNSTAPAEAVQAKKKGGSSWEIIGPVFIATTVGALLFIFIGFAVFKYRSKAKFQATLNSAPMHT